MPAQIMISLSEQERIELEKAVLSRMTSVRLVERFFGLLTEKALRRGVFTSVKELETKIQTFIDHHNDKSKPFVWTKSASRILEKVDRATQSLSLMNSV